MYEVNHIGVIVNDVEKSAKFYVDNFGAKITRRHKDERITIIFVSSGNGVVELIEYLKDDEKKKLGIDHIAYTVDDIEEALQNLKDENVKLISAEPKYFENDKIFFFEGLNGEKFEYVQIGK